jgi:hypothetical protein
MSIRAAKGSRRWSAAKANPANLSSASRIHLSNYERRRAKSYARFTKELIGRCRSNSRSLRPGKAIMHAPKYPKPFLTIRSEQGGAKSAKKAGPQQSPSTLILGVHFGKRPRFRPRVRADIGSRVLSASLVRSGRKPYPVPWTLN